ncbi:MAG: hypoxanthine phosphoribosyltransferase [Actinomycetota bacterium]
MSQLAFVRFTAGEVSRRVAELAEQLKQDLHGERPVLLSVIKGSVIFMADLSRALGTDADIEFLSVSEFAGGAPKTGVVRIIKDLEIPIHDRQVVVVETIVDTGLTLSFLLRNLQNRGPRSLRVCTLLDKPVRRIAPLPLDYVGFEVSEFMVGYGLGIKGKYRNLPYLVGVRDVAALAADPTALRSMLGDDLD